jgi:hypothetical protein
MAASRLHGTTWVPMAANNLLRRNDALVQLSCLVPPIFRSFAIPDLPESCDEGRSISLRGLIARAWLSVPAFSCSRAALCRHLSLSVSVHGFWSRHKRVRGLAGREKKFGPFSVRTV